MEKPDSASPEVSSEKAEAAALWAEIEELRAKIEQKLIVFLFRKDIPDEIKELFKR